MSGEIQAVTIQWSKKHLLLTVLGSKRYLFQHSKGSEQGLTLIECIIAIMVLVLVGTAIAPAMVLSVATRVQSQRAEQALEIAQSEIDRVRLLVERREDLSGGDVAAIIAEFPPLAGGVATITDAPAPDAFNCAPTATQGLPVSLDPAVDPCNLDPDQEPDFVIQSYRTEGINTDAGVPRAFEMGVRVYDSRAFRDGGSDSLLTENATLGPTSGEGSRLNRPLAVLYTDIVASEEGDSLCRFIEYQGDPSEPLPLGCS